MAHGNGSMFNVYCSLAVCMSIILVLVINSLHTKVEWLNARHCGQVVSAPAWDGTGCDFDSWQCLIYIPCS